jgi:hypothetical protein
MAKEKSPLDEALGNQTRAAEWRSLRKALSERLRALRASRDAATGMDEQIALARQIETIEAQVDTLRVEEAVAQFVEDSVRYTIAASHMEDEPDEESGFDLLPGE